MLRSVRRYSSEAARKVTVIGAGQMGVGIAYVAAANAKANVTLLDQSDASLQKGLAFVDKLLLKNVSKSKLTQEQADSIRSKISTSSDFEGSVADTQYVIEAVPEIPALKAQIFGQLAQVASPQAILGTNTSSISITKIAAAAKGAESRVIGMHFMNPVPVQPGVEVIRGLQTSEDTYVEALKLIGDMGKKISSSRDMPGFLANRILLPYINEAIIALETGVGEKEDIDNIMKNGCAMPMGPLQLADFIGLDTCLSIMTVLYNDTGDSKYRPSMLLHRMVDAGWTGVKSGKGFYDYTK